MEDGHCIVQTFLFFAVISRRVEQLQRPQHKGSFRIGDAL
jgi:hypothetical protein